MTKNYYLDGPPPAGRPWAQAARNPEGVFGVAFGIGKLQIGLITEDQIEAFVRTAMQDGERDDLLGLVVSAAEALPKFKHDFERRMAQGAAADRN